MTFIFCLFVPSSEILTRRSKTCERHLSQSAALGCVIVLVGYCRKGLHLIWEQVIRKKKQQGAALGITLDVTREEHFKMDQVHLNTEGVELWKPWLPGY